MSRLLAIVILLGACGSPGGAGDGGGDDAPSSDGGPPRDAPGTVAISAFDPSITRVSVEIDYETGEAPYTGTMAGFGDTFDISIANIERLFAGTKPIAIPRTVATMEDIGAVADEQVTVADILALAAAHRSQRDAPGLKTYYVVFVSGLFTDAVGPKAGVLGVSLGTTGVIAMFKDVIASTSAVGNVQRFVEQSTLVHELGHAIGLVNNGVPLSSPHQDGSHGAHCTDRDCVMYWQNEGASDMTAWATQHVLANTTILFRPDCLADVDALTGGP
ncbi:MAG: hypothetical protein M3680_25565 [Myxococcota bacterium]|nr:hypothetical protein [Myxococcota bacterium]